jgi:hypothetical protein
VIETHRRRQVQVHAVARGSPHLGQRRGGTRDIRLTDARVVDKHYDLTSGADLDLLLDELVTLLGEDISPAAVVAHRPTPPVYGERSRVQ